MNRQEIQGEFETVMLSMVQASPCVRCGGDPFNVHANARQLAYYLFEVVKSALGKDGTLHFNEGVTLQHARERAEKKVVQFFGNLSTEELSVLLATAPGEHEMSQDSEAPDEPNALEPPAPQPDGQLHPSEGPSPDPPLPAESMKTAVLPEAQAKTSEHSEPVEPRELQTAPTSERQDTRSSPDEPQASPKEKRGPRILEPSQVP